MSVAPSEAMMDDELPDWFRRSWAALSYLPWTRPARQRRAFIARVARVEEAFAAAWTLGPFPPFPPEIRSSRDPQIFLSFLDYIQRLAVVADTLSRTGDPSVALVVLSEMLEVD